MSGSEDLQKYVGQNVDAATKELESQGYTVHLVSTGSHATGHVPPQKMHMGEDGKVIKEKRAVISFNGDDPERKVGSIREN